MIKTQLDRDGALKILELGEKLKNESQFRNEPYDSERVWQLLDATVRFPNQRFIAYDDEFRGFIIMGINEHYFSGIKRAEDFALWIAPEHRGGTLVLRLLRAAEEWAEKNGATSMTIYHNTGIQTDKSPRLFNKLGYDTAGYIFTKELTDVRNH